MQGCADVLAFYPVLRGARIVPASKVGFSGAGVWRLVTSAGEFCLRACASGETRPHMQQRHTLMARACAAGLQFVPVVLPSAKGTTVVEAAGRCWEVMDWMPGRADFHAAPTTARLQNAATALARLHNVWQSASTIGPCPAVMRRLEVSQRALPVIDLARAGHSPLDDLLARTRRILIRWIPEVPRLLQPWRNFTCHLQPCLRDVWHDHLRFEGDRLTGLVDYAGMGVDSPAADLARMLGSLVEDEDESWGVALRAYRAERAFSSDEERLARILDRTGVIAGLSNWLRWLGEPGRISANVHAAVQRVAELLDRVASW
jgi:Ser/Thr protein kinase RdoA (MazF antagonist)